MNLADQKRLLNTLSLTSQEAMQPRRQVPGARIGFILSLSALSVWLVVQFKSPEVSAAEDGPHQAPEAANASPAYVATVADEPSSVLLQATGYVTASQSATVSARTTAVVDSVYVEEGDTVKQGTLLARLDDRLKRAEHGLAVSRHAGATVRVAEVEAELAAARRRMGRIKSLAISQLVSAAELDEIETQVDILNARLATVHADVRIAAEQVRVHQVALGDFLIHAPFDGVITERSAQPGEIVSPMSGGGGFTRTGIATLVDMASLEIEVDVNETHISKVRENHPVKVILTAYPDVTYSGNVIAIIPKGDRNKGTVKVRIKLMGGDAHVLPEMGARVDFLMV